MRLLDGAEQSGGREKTPSEIHPARVGLIHASMNAIESLVVNPDERKRRLPDELPPPSEIDAVAGPRQRMMRSTEFARGLSISPRTVRRAYARGALPGAIEHSAHILMIPTHLFRLAATYGLRHVERMAKAGLL